MQARKRAAPTVPAPFQSVTMMTAATVTAAAVVEAGAGGAAAAVVVIAAMRRRRLELGQPICLRCVTGLAKKGQKAVSVFEADSTAVFQ